MVEKRGRWVGGHDEERKKVNGNIMRGQEKTFEGMDRTAHEATGRRFGPTRVCWYLRAFLCDASAAIDTLSLIQK